MASGLNYSRGLQAVLERAVGWGQAVISQDLPAVASRRKKVGLHPASTGLWWAVTV